MDSNSIFERLSLKTTVDQQYEVFIVENERCYFGKDCDGNIVFMIPSSLENVSPVSQETRALGFAFNKKCTFENSGKTETKTVHLLTCKDHTPDRIKAFIRLTKAFAQTERDNDQYYLAKLFSSLSSLFDKTHEVSKTELQGLFAELYVILHFHSINCDISTCWQSRNMMRFDFTIDEKKRIEIKSTMKPSRTHHFKHDQLLSELYDIKIVSVMLQSGDCGVSLGDLIEEIREIYADDYPLLMHVESVASHVDCERLYGTKYDQAYIQNNLRYYDALSIPHFNEKTPDGVFNAEYDCVLDTAHSLSETDIVNWVKGA